MIERPTYIPLPTGILVRADSFSVPAIVTAEGNITDDCASSDGSKLGDQIAIADVDRAELGAGVCIMQALNVPG